MVKSATGTYTKRGGRYRRMMDSHYTPISQGDELQGGSREGAAARW